MLQTIHTSYIYSLLNVMVHVVFAEWGKNGHPLICFGCYVRYKQSIDTAVATFFYIQLL